MDGNHPIARFSWVLFFTAGCEALVCGSALVNLVEDGPLVLGFFTLLDEVTSGFVRNIGGDLRRAAVPVGFLQGQSSS